MDNEFFRAGLMIVFSTWLCGCESPYQPSPKVNEEPLSELRSKFAHELPVPDAARIAHPAFHTMMDVLTDKKCVNCHPDDGVPRQGEDGAVIPGESEEITTRRHAENAKAFAEMEVKNVQLEKEGHK